MQGKRKYIFAALFMSILLASAAAGTGQASLAAASPQNFQPSGILLQVSGPSVRLCTSSAIAVRSLKLSRTSVIIIKGKVYTLRATVSPSNATVKTVTWKSSNKSIATVSSKGKVTAKKAGKCTITATTKNGIKKQCKITVKNPVAVRSLKLSRTSITINQGKSYTLRATVSPSNATVKTVTWKSSNKSIATVSSKGKVTAKKAGKCTITATTKNGIKKQCKITVKPVYSMRSVKSVKLSKSKISAVKGYTYTIKATVSPSNAAVKTVKWKTTNKKVATVSSKGKVYAKNTGSCTVVATSNNGKKAICKVKVSKPVAVKSVNLSGSSITLAAGKTYALKATVSPSSATVKTLMWKSSNTSVATVSSKGVVTAKGTGKCTVTAASNNGKKDSITVVSLSNLLYVDTNLNGSYITTSLAVKGYSFSPSGVASVQICLDGKTLGYAATGVQREDAYAKYPWYGKHYAGFTYSLTDMSKISSGNHTVTVKSVGKDGSVVSKSFTVYKKSPVSAVESPPTADGYYGNTITVSGYALNASGIKSVYVYLDKDPSTGDQSGRVGTAKTGIARSDIAAKYSVGYADSKTSGYSYSLDISSLISSDFYSVHTVYIEAVGEDGVSSYAKATFHAGNVITTSYTITFSAMVAAEMNRNPPYYDSSLKKTVYPNSYLGTSDADKAEYSEILNAVTGYLQPLTPSTTVVGSKLSYKFVRLCNSDPDFYNFVSASVIDDVINQTLSSSAYAGKTSSLKGTGQYFIDAAKKYHLDPIYLVSHAILETGWGTSTLARGVVIDNVRYYNLWGICAYDSGATYYGSQAAQEYGWDTVQKAIDGGAEWISTRYINSSTYNQNTLYKMRWNPNVTWHQYCTSLTEMDSIAGIMQKFYSKCSNVPPLIYDFPKYLGS